MGRVVIEQIPDLDQHTLGALPPISAQTTAAVSVVREKDAWVVQPSRMGWPIVVGMVVFVAAVGAVVAWWIQNKRPPRELMYFGLAMYALVFVTVAGVILVGRARMKQPAMMRWPLDGSAVRFPSIDQQIDPADVVAVVEVCGSAPQRLGRNVSRREAALIVQQNGRMYRYHLPGAGAMLWDWGKMKKLAGELGVEYWRVQPEQ